MPIDPKVLDAMVEAGAEVNADYACRIHVNGIPTPATNLSKCGGHCVCRLLAKESILAALRAAEALNVPHNLVGREATEMMLSVGWDTVEHGDRPCPEQSWPAMFDAAPVVSDD